MRPSPSNVDLAYRGEDCIVDLRAGSSSMGPHNVLSCCVQDSVDSVSGALMVTAWMSTGSLGMVVARYLRGVSKGQKLWGKDVWFLVRQDEDDGSESALFSACPCLTCLPGPCHCDECDHSCHSCRLHPALLLRPDLV